MDRSGGVVQEEEGGSGRGHEGPDQRALICLAYCTRLSFGCYIIAQIVLLDQYIHSLVPYTLDGHPSVYSIRSPLLSGSLSS